MLQLLKDNQINNPDTIAGIASESILEKDTSLRSVHLDALRGISALIVVGGHERGMFFSTLASPSAQEKAGASVGTYVRDDLNIGHEAVMVFFVLSGFLVGGSVLKLVRGDSWSWTNYLIKRLTRLWVVLIPALLLSFTLDVGGSHFFSGTASIYSAPLGQDYVHMSDLSALYHPAIIFGKHRVSAGCFCADGGNQWSALESGERILVLHSIPDAATWS